MTGGGMCGNAWDNGGAKRSASLLFEDGKGEVPLIRIDGNKWASRA